MATSAESRVLDLVHQLSLSHPTHWVAVQEVAQRTGLRRGDVDAIVRSAVGKGQMLAEGEPPHRVSLRYPGTDVFQARRMRSISAWFGV